MQTINCFDALNEMAPRFQTGALLLTGNIDNKNVMTIGWGTFGIVWSKPICEVFVRHSRATHELIEHSDYFTVAFPHNGEMKEVLSYCGRMSARDTDKISDMKLRVGEYNGKKDMLYLPEFEYNVICRKVFSVEGALDNMDSAIRERFYDVSSQSGNNGDPHTIYFGEIVDTLRR